MRRRVLATVTVGRTQAGLSPVNVRITMRIIAGRFRGRSLEAPSGYNTRPITDRAKESLFSILGSRFDTPGALPDFDVLDLFAGTGGLGIEAVSRGARSCLFVERDRRALRALYANIERLRLPEAFHVLSANVWTMRIPAPADGGYGVAFLDPPYRDVDEPTRVLDLIDRIAPRIASGGLLVFRFEWRSRFPAEQVRSLALVDEREFGHMKLMFFAHAPGATEGAPPTSRERES